MSRLYKAYGGYVPPRPHEAECVKEVYALPQFKGVEWPLSLRAEVLSYRTTGMAGNATNTQITERNRLINECIARKQKQIPIPDLGDTGNLVYSIPLPWLIAGVLGLAVVLLMVTRK